MTNADRCPVCGGMLALIGRVHRCIPVSRGEQMASGVIDRRMPEKAIAPVHAGPRELKPKYLHRSDADGWRAYMRGYMKRKRAKNSVVGQFDACG